MACRWGSLAGRLFHLLLILLKQSPDVDGEVCVVFGEAELASYVAADVIMPLQICE